MIAFHVNVVAVNPQDQQQSSTPVRALVDPGSELTWLPADVLTAAGIKPVRQCSFSPATSQVVQRDVGYAILRAENLETIDEVVFAQPGDANLLGVRTIEGFGVVVDNIGHRFVATTTLVAGCSGSWSPAPGP
jgi:predicted aspartyl protease